MTPPSSLSTNLTLLGKLRQSPRDRAAGEEFVERYGPRIYAWCRHWRLGEEDAQDVTQNVLVRLAEKMSTFHYDPSGSFRGWLWTLTRHAWQDYVEGQGRQVRASGDSDSRRCLAEAPAREDLVQRLNEEFDRELLDEAMARVRLRVEPQTWEAFRLLALEGWTGAETGQKLGMKVASVFVARSNVQKLLRREIQDLERAEGRDES